LIIPIIIGEEFKLWSSSLCSFLQPPVTSSLFDLKQRYRRKMLFRTGSPIRHSVPTTLRIKSSNFLMMM
jgi:hypothetical protein